MVTVKLPEGMMTSIDTVLQRGESRAMFMINAINYQIQWRGGLAAEPPKRICLHCGSAFNAIHRRRRYCSNACRCAAFQRRKRNGHG